MNELWWQTGTDALAMLVRLLEVEPGYERVDRLPAGWDKAPSAATLRCVVGNPARRSTLDPACINPTVIKLAQAAEEYLVQPGNTLEPDRLAVLSDALEEAGCTDTTLLGHLRDPGPHVCGCHVLDAILTSACT